MRYADALAYLDRHVNLEASAAVAGRVEGLSLERIERLLAVLGDPHLAAPAIHITGTNGKGSVARSVTELLVAQGLEVGTYTSPHLEAVNERIARDGRPIGDDELAQVMAELEAVEPLCGVEPSYFELLTAAAFAWFAEIAVDVVVVEVGLLGRWDATNVVDGRVAVITNIGADHTDFGEGWREAVAREKAGIIKQGSVVVVGETDPALVRIFAETVDLAGGELVSLGHQIEVLDERVAVGGRLLSLRTPYAAYDDLYLPLAGTHQSTNALLALAAAEGFFGRALEREVVDEAFARTTVPGRLEVMGRHPLVIIDGAHNPDGATALARSLDEFVVDGRRTVVLGMLAGRDPRRLLQALDLAGFDRIVATTAPSPRGLPARDLAGTISELGVVSEVVDDPLDAIRSAVDRAAADDLVVVTGSLYLAGLARGAARGLVGGSGSP